MLNLGVLSSRIHLVWTIANGGTLEDRPVYTKSRCFDPFPFLEANNIQKQTIRVIAEELDVTASAYLPSIHGSRSRSLQHLRKAAHRDQAG